MCFFKDKKQQHIQLVQAHDDQTATLQMSMSPSDDDFVHNYMIHVQETSIQQQQQNKVKNTIYI